MHSGTFRSIRVGTQPRFQSGFSLIELMISVTIGLVILAGLVAVFASSSSSSKTNDRSAEVMTNGRYALDSVRKELREAGFRAFTWAEPLSAAALGAITNECLQAGATATTFVANMRQGVWGANSDGGSPFESNCIPKANLADGSDVLVVRRLGIFPVATAALQTNGIYFLSNYEQGQVFRGKTLPSWGTTLPIPSPLATFPVEVYVYYVRPWTVSASEVPLVPALVRVALRQGNTVDPFMETELVASGVERFQVQFAQRTTALNTRYLNPGEGPLTGSSSATDVTDWETVNAVRLWVLARSTTPEPGLDPSGTTYSMGDITYTPPKDGLRRQLLSSVVQLRN